MDNIEQMKTEEAIAKVKEKGDRPGTDRNMKLTFLVTRTI